MGQSGASRGAIKVPAKGVDVAVTEQHDKYQVRRPRKDSSENL